MKQLVLCLFLLLTACERQGPPAPTEEQSNELNETDQLLDNMANEEGPEANAPGPSNSSD